MKPHISLAAETIFHIGFFPVTNSLLVSWLVMLLLFVFAYYAGRKFKISTPSNLQQFGEMIVENLYSLFATLLGEENVNKYFPLLATLFLYIIIGNWIGLLPGMGSIGFYEKEPPQQLNSIIVPAKASESNFISESEPVAVEVAETQHEGPKFVPLFRGTTADLNTTFALALIAVISLQYYGLKTLKLGYLKKFFNFTNPIMAFVGILELISEFSRIISFAFRLFGNVFAGEVLLTVMTFLIPVFVPIPFLGLELFVGFVQALVFAMLTGVFLKMAITSHESH